MIIFSKLFSNTGNGPVFSLEWTIYSHVGYLKLFFFNWPIFFSLVGSDAGGRMRQLFFDSDVLWAGRC